MNRITLLLSATLLLLGACQWNSNRQKDANEDAPATTTESGNPYISDNQAEETPALEEDLSGNVIALSASDFVKRITDIDNPQGFRYKGHTPCVVDFYADWCRPCMSIKPMMEKMAKKYKGQLIIYKINVDRAQDVCAAFGIQNIPTLMFFNTTDQPRKMVGAPSETEMENAIRDFLK